ncbi:MAG: formate--tetrahydrofolate ligase [Hydrotalea sp.]|nr:formate--tetrahydrofolate ligase [Hydrotalea sp.]
MATVPSDIEIARAATMKPISTIAKNLGIPDEALNPYGRTKAKIDRQFLDKLPNKKSKLILVTAISPTPAGEGKTTTSVGLHDALCRIGKKSIVALREPSLGPCFGVKGGAAGGGYAQVVPMEDINLHFTGDFHAITSAHNLLSALIDNHIYWGNKLRIDSRRVSWRRVLDMNDRALRQTIISLGGASNGYPRESGFDITVASEVMAIFCLATSLEDLEKRLGDIVIAQNMDKEPVRARDLKAEGPMTVLLKDAFSPNLVQTLENNPAMIHGGPFANIAHGCNSVSATTSALKLADYVVTEAGFGADLGAEKFFDIKCRKAGLSPAAVVVVATVRALKMHGGVAKPDLGKENVAALQKGLANLERHLQNLGKFGVPAVVAINRFHQDTEKELAAIGEFTEKMGVSAFPCTHWGEGSKGTEALAKKVVEVAESGMAQFRPLYPDNMPLFDKITTIAREIYRADEVQADSSVRQKLKTWEDQGFGHFPICMAKTQYSFSTDPKLMGAPLHHNVPVREVRLAAGAGFIVAICGDIMTMPGLPSVPSAEKIHLNKQGEVEGLF